MPYRRRRWGQRERESERKTKGREGFSQACSESKLEFHAPSGKNVV